MKKEYIQPTMRVVVIKRRCHLLAGSGRSVTGITSEDFSFDRDGLEDEETDM